MKKILLFTGTDALILVKNPPGNKIWHIKLIFYRLKWKLLHHWFHEKWVNNTHLIKYLHLFGIKVSKIYETDLLYPTNYGKQKHDIFTILYYCPKAPANLGGMKFIHWIYGYDINQKILQYYGSQKRQEVVQSGHV